MHRMAGAVSTIRRDAARPESDVFPIPPRDIPTDTLMLGPLIVESDRHFVEAVLDCTTYIAAGTLLTLAFEVSYDGGTVWEFVTSTGRPAGAVTGDDGTTETSMYFSMELRPEQSGIRRIVRCPVTLVGTSFASAGGYIEVYT